MLNTFYTTRYGVEGVLQHQIRITFDEQTNKVFVQAGPSDLDEIRRLIEQMDSPNIGATLELRVIPVKIAFSDDLANLISLALSDRYVSTVAGATGPGAPTLPGGGPLGTNTALFQQAGATARQSKVYTLRFIGDKQGKEGKAVEGGVLDDIRIMSDSRTNSLIVVAPEKTMQLIYALVAQLDAQPNARATINVHMLKKADAAQLANALQQLISGASGQLGAPRPGGGPTTGPGGGPGTTTGGQRLSPISPGPGGPESTPIIDLRITVDDRTNSLIVAGSPADLAIVDGIVLRLDNASIPERRNETYKLRNAQAADMAASLTDFFTKATQVYKDGAQLTNFQTILRETVITADPFTNNLLISAAPQYFDMIMRIVAELDAAPPQVVVQVLLAEVDLSDSNEFGMEVALQSPVLFQRSFIPGGGTVLVNSVLPQQAVPGFNFNNTLLPVGSNTIINQGTVGYQSLGNLGVGRISPTNNVGGFVFTAASDTVNVLIRALRVQSRIDILSRPQLTTVDGQTAQANFGLDFPILGQSSTTATGVIVQSITRTKVGIKLEITPKIMSDGRVVMRVIPEVSSVINPPINLGNGLVSNALNIEQLETTVSAYDGETIVLGGFISTSDNRTENKIPWLGDLPILGAAFRYRTQNKQKKELLVIMTPHVMFNTAHAERVLAEEAHRMDWRLQDVVKVHGTAFLDGTANYLPKTTTIDGATPGLETAPPPKPFMPPANKTPPQPPAPGSPQAAPPQPSAMQAPAMQAPTYNGPAATGGQPAAQGPAANPQAVPTAPANFAQPVAQPTAERNSAAHAAGESFSSRVVVQKASDFVPQASPGSIAIPNAPAANSETPARTPVPIYLPTFPNPQPVANTPAREVQQ
jgi:type II secretory pathway component GspD/PulD (secretin)